ncbi:Acid phosphatase [Alicyclobacillus pomorum]|uniref:divergent PAP2 family protein n=1 Tax=Alicyclobacillus pomorum TaxID=204470 RepID=UPI0006877C1F
MHGQVLLFSSILAMVVAQLYKVIAYRWYHKEWKWSRFLVTGGMPSSHTALMCTLTTSCLFFYGWSSPWFAVSFVSSIVVIYDAIGVRRQAGEHALILHELIAQLHEAGVDIKPHVFRRFRHWQRQGHTPAEVVGGVLLGVVIALVSHIVLCLQAKGAMIF